MYREQGFKVHSILLDSESGLIALAEDNQRSGVKITYAPPGQHVPTIERKIRLVKERCRAVLSALPCPLTKHLLLSMMKFCVSRLNLLPIQGSRTTPHTYLHSSPKELLTGRKTSYTRDLRCGFLDYAQVTEPVGETTHNTLKPRTRGAVALFPLGNSIGSVRFMALDTGLEITREKFHTLPMPDIVVNHLTAMAAKDRKTVPRDPTFQYHGTEILHTEHPEDNSDHDIFQPLDPEPIALGDDEEQQQPPNPPTTDQSHPADPEPIDIGGDYGPPMDPPATDLADYHPDPTDIGGADDLRGDTDPPPPTVMTIPASIRPTAFVRDPYLLRPRKATALPVQEERVYKLSVRAALDTHGPKALDAMILECTNLLGKNTFHPVYRSALTNSQAKATIRSSLFMKEKTTPDGKFDKIKARLVARGDQQDKSIYAQEDTSSPTVSTTAVFMTIAAKERRKVITIDVETAYLNAKMVDDRPVFMKIDPLVTAILSQLDATYTQYMDASGGVTVKLDRALYGCVESAVLWYRDLKSTLEDAGFIMNPYDICVFNKLYDGEQVTVIFHVDDLLGSSVLDEALEELYNVLIKKYGKVKVTRGDTHSYLGMVLRFIGDGTATVAMPAFIADIILESGVTGTAPTPADEYLFALRESPALSEEQSRAFHKIAAKVAYLAQHARWDMLTLTSFLTSRVQHPTVDDQNKLVRGIKYLNGTRDLVLTLGATDPIKITAHVDAAFGSHGDDYRSLTGVYISMGIGGVYCKSSKQKLMTKSSTEAELVTISDALPQIV